MLTVPRPGRQQEKGRRPGRKKGVSVLMGPPPSPTPAPSRKRVSQVVRRHSETCAPSLVVREIPAKTPGHRYVHLPASVATTKDGSRGASSAQTARRRGRGPASAGRTADADPATPPVAAAGSGWERPVQDRPCNTWCLFLSLRRREDWNIPSGTVATALGRGPPRACR